MEKFRKKEQYFTRVREALEYGVYHVAGELEIEAYISAEPLSFADRTGGMFRRLKPGDHWGDLFDCGWFHFRGQVPKEARGLHTAVLVDASAEGLLVDGAGNPVQGLTSATSRNEFPLGLWGKRTIEMADCSEDGVKIDFWVDFTCCDVEGQYRNNGRVKEACVAVIDDVCRDAFYDWVVCQSLYVGLCENGDAYGETVGGILEQAASLLTDALSCGGPESGDTSGTEQMMKGRDAYAQDDGAVRGQGLDMSGERLSVWPDTETNHTLQCQRKLNRDALLRVREILGKILNEKNTAPSMQYSAMGHSHLDLLFLWPERETYRKCARTLSTVVKMMDRFPEYKFCLSQAPVYRWMKDMYPSLYRRLTQLIREKRIEVTGAFWVECDTNLPCGESLVRQLLYGKRFFREEFGLDMKVGFLPDVFGYSAALPQLFVKSGVPYFTTNKLSMNDTNRFPRYTFWWHGLDGSRVLTHMLPENSYTSAAVPQMAIYGEYHHTDKDVSPEGIQLYGLGDGGGGPGYEHMERRRRTRDLKGCPPYQDEFIEDFFDRIAGNGEKYRKWDGELYFERHQGTYTSIARQKKWNRTLERTLHVLEWLASVAGARLSIAYPQEWLKACWEDVMLYQFHDCLPGSSIRRVYEETQYRYEQMYRQARERIEALKGRLAGCVDLSGMREPVVVFNPVSFRRVERLEAGGRELTVTLEPYEIRGVDWADAGPAETQAGPDGAQTGTDARDRVLENRLVRMEFAPDGTVVSLYDKAAGRELLPAGQTGNQLNLYPDELTHWDIQKEYLQKEPQRARLTQMRKVTNGACQRIYFTYDVGERSHIRQTAVLEEYSARVDFRTWVDWQEEYQMLRVAWPVDVAAREAMCDIQFGHIGRPVSHNTSWEEAKFEVCAHKWADLSDADGGLALMNDCKYGYKVWDRVLDLCLLRSQNCPCERGDVGEHTFTYSIYPHGAGLWESGVIEQGYALNYPPEVWRADALFLPAKPETVKPQPWTLTRLQGVVLETVKQAESGEGYVLRLYETRGGRGEARISLDGYEAAGICSLLEEIETDQSALERTPEGIRIRFHAFEIQSVLLRPCRKNK